MRLSIRLISIATLGLLFLFATAFSAPKTKRVGSKKTVTTEQSSETVVKKQTPVESADQTKDSKQTTTIENGTIATPVQPQTATPYVAPAATTSSAAAAYSINWFVIAAGGTSGSSTNYIVNGTAGQTSVGMGSSTNYNVNAGFWQNFGPGGCCIGNRGDCNNDGTDANILDLNFLVNRVFRGGPAPVCAEEGDCNSDGTSANILDLNFLVNRVFRGGPAPGPC